MANLINLEDVDGNRNSDNFENSLQNILVKYLQKLVECMAVGSRKTSAANKTIARKMISEIAADAAQQTGMISLFLGKS